MPHHLEGQPEHGAHSFLRPAHGSPEDYKGLVPVEQLDLSKIDLKGVSEMMYAFENGPFAPREIGQAVTTLETMVRDPDCFVVMTLSGAMTPAQRGLVITDMIDSGMVQAVVSTGALMAHGFVQSAGMKHFMAEQPIPDAEANERRLNRILDVYEPEDNLDEVERIVNSAVLSRLDPKVVYSDSDFTEMLGEYLHSNTSPEQRGILKSTYRNGVPVFVPAFTDSELGLDGGLYNRVALFRNGLRPFQFNPFKDLERYAELIYAQGGKKLGIITVGGGVPRNWAQQVGPYVDLIDKRMQDVDPTYLAKEPAMFSYGLRICPDDVRWGGLSGCTYEEGKSWGKMREDGTFTEVIQDATVMLPWIVGAALYRLGYKFDERPIIQKNVSAGPEAWNAIKQKVDLWFNPTVN